MKYLIFLIVLLLVACGGVEDDSLGYGWNYDTEDTLTGIRVRYSASTTEHSMPLETLVQYYKLTQSCMNQFADGPLIIFVDGIINNQENINGLAISSGIILLRTSKVFDENFHLKSEILIEEYIHHIFYQNNNFSDENQNHGSSFFYDCGAGRAH